LILRIKDTLAGVLPLSRILLGVRKFADICSDLAKGGGDYVVRQIDWLCKLSVFR
jgi:hypothetical protein